MGENGTIHNSESNDGIIIVIAIIVVFLGIIFLLFFHLYAKLFWFSSRSNDGLLPSRPTRRRFIFAQNQDPVLSLHQGLESSVILSLPIMIFNHNEFKDGLECAVCLCELSDGEKARLLPKCNHGFHVDCIDMWFHSHSTCPLCRNPVLPQIAISNPNVAEIESPDGNSNNGYLTESLNFPTNILFWGNQTHVSAVDSNLEGGSSSSSSSSSLISRPNETLVIEIPLQLSEPVSSLSSSTNESTEEESNSPRTKRLRPLKRFLSREKENRVFPCSPGSVDIEHGKEWRDLCSKTGSDS